MIRPLRRLHRGAVTVLAVALPVAFGLALGARPPAPSMPELPAALAADSGPQRPPLVDRDDLFTAVPTHLRAWSIGPRLHVELRLLVGDPPPSLLAYWSRRDTGGADLPADAVLLGTVSAHQARSFELPGRGGHLLLYSLGHAEVADRAPLPAPGGAS